jgi:hypothetical protein|tara:strand:+ start:680 stop:1048 length:369 start_codon:yes stop_codon:yes gene_type:complete
MKKLNDLLSEVTKLRSEIKTVQAEEKLLKTQQRELESQISIRMQEQGLDKISNDVCTISLKNEIVPTVENWDDLHEHIVKTGQFELLQKRMSATAYRELITAGMDVPGVKSTELTRVNFRSA